ncbi:hypothetical protein [Nocardiopsis sp. LOL_012]
MPYTVVRDEDGIWCAEADAGGAGVGLGHGRTRDEALADRREGLALLAQE